MLRARKGGNCEARSMSDLEDLACHLMSPMVTTLRLWQFHYEASD